MNHATSIIDSWVFPDKSSTIALSKANKEAEVLGMAGTLSSFSRRRRTLRK